MIIPTTPPTRTGIVTSMMDADGTTADRTTQGRGTGTRHMRTTYDTSSAPAYATADSPSETGPAADVDLRHHGDREVGPGLVDLAVNVRGSAPPAWLTERIAESLAHLAAYPDATAARAAVADRHRRPVGEVLLTAGAAEAFVLLARALTPRHTVVVHPQFTEPEAALRAAGHTVRRVLLTEREGFGLDPAQIPEEADLVVIGNPTNPTSVLHSAGTLAALARPGRVLVVDEAFADAIPGEPESLAERRDLAGLVVVRSLTKTWALAGLRIGYLLAPSDLVRRCAEAQPLWSVSTPALVAAEACSGPDALAHASASAVTLATDRAFLVERLRAIPGVRLPVEPRASFVLAHVEDGLKVRELLRERGFAVRRADTFPGLGPDWLRIAVRDRATTTAFTAALEGVLTT
ncbi:Rv2231c family pyridoxal phosphate-dependent protein CobC [Streptomycetaceae bacterium NBC_01309]